MVCAMSPRNDWHHEIAYHDIVQKGGGLKYKRYM